MKSNTFDVYCEGQLEFIQLDAILAPASPLPAFIFESYSLLF